MADTALRFLSHLSGDEAICNHCKHDYTFLSHLSGDEDISRVKRTAELFLSHLSGDEVTQHHSIIIKSVSKSPER